MQIHSPGFFEYAIDTLLAPINFIIYIPILLWFIEGNTSFAVQNIFIILALVVILYIFVKLSRGRLIKYSQIQVQSVRVRRNNTLTQIATVDLVPGDVLIVEKSMLMPCDCVLMKGEVLVDENTLTGEVDPISKLEIPKSDVKFDYGMHSLNFLFDGTRILNINQRFGDAEVQALVVRTGYSSFKVGLPRLHLSAHTHLSTRRVASDNLMTQSKGSQPGPGLGIRLRSSLTSLSCAPLLRPSLTPLSDVPLLRPLASFLTSACFLRR